MPENNTHAPGIIKHGKLPDIIEFDQPDGTCGFAVVVTKSLELATEVTAEIISRYNHHPHLVRLLLRLNDAVEALDGTSTDNEALVDEYRAILSALGS